MSLMSMMANPPNNSSKPLTPKREHSPRLSPIFPLAPLEFLQTQRRGSITDPSLHAAPSRGHAPSPLFIRQNNSDVGGIAGRSKSPYVFGEATPRSGESSSSQLRKLLRSPSLERVDRPLSASGRKEGPVKGRIEGMKVSGQECFVIDSDKDERPVFKAPGAFDYSMRRHSIAVGLDSPFVGMKRKMSGERMENGDRMEVDDTGVDGPAAKRRGSVVDTSRIAKLSLDDRRHSVDDRGGGPLWRTEGRRGLSSSLYSGGILGTGSAGSESGNSRQTPGLANFAWPPLSAQSAMQHPLDHDPQRQYDPMGGVPGGVPGMAPINYSPDRRMSISDHLNPNSNNPNRVLRSRSRPPSRQMHNADGQDDVEGAPSPSGSSKMLKDQGATPYSRSPELRVSHKLAERKRRKEMKELFDELRDQLPADRGMKASKWEILSKAIDFVNQLKQTHQDMAREIDVLRHELDISRQANGLPPFAPPGNGHVVVYNQPPPGVPPYPPLPPPPGAMQQQQHPPPDMSRPPSSQGVFHPPNGNAPT